MAKTVRDRSTPGYKELREAVKAGNISRLYVLTGEETFLMDRFLQLLSLTLIRPETAALDQVTITTYRTGNRLTVDRLRVEVMSPPFFSPRRLVIVRQSGWFAPARSVKSLTLDADETDDSADNDSSVATDDETPTRGTAGGASSSDQLAALLAALPDSVCLVFCEQKIDRRLKNLMTTVQKVGTLGEFAHEQPATLIKWIDGEFKRRSLTIERPASESLIDRCDSQMQVIWNEMSKLFLYAAGKGLTSIDLAVIEDLSLPDLRGTIFDLTDAISSGRTSQALTLLDTLIAQKQPVQLITFMLARHFRQLIVARELGAPDRIAARLKVMPFVASRLLNQSRSMPSESLEEQYLACFDADLAVKTGKITDRLALETLFVSASELVRNQKNSAINRTSMR